MEFGPAANSGELTPRPQTEANSAVVHVCAALEDDKLAEDLVKHLKSLGVRLTYKIDAGESEVAGRQARIDAADVVLLLVSADFLACKKCLADTQHALDRLAKGAAKVIPVIGRHCLWKQQDFAQIPILPRNAVPILAWADKDAALQDVADALSACLRAPGPEPEGPCPFPGLEYFDEEKADFFFGRETQIEEALAMLRGPSERRWLQIDGPSGVGKSSFARAGIVPAIRTGKLGAGPKAWVVAVCRPGPNPLQNLARAVYDALVLGGQVPMLNNVRGKIRLFDEVQENFTNSKTALRSLIHECQPQHERSEYGVLLVIDQLEEVFTLAGTDRTAVRMLDELLDCALADKERPLYLITTIRSDFTGRMGDMPRLAQRLSTEAGRYFLQAMDRKALLDVVRKPADVAKLVWAEGLPERIVDDAAASVGALPLIAHMLQSLYDAREGRALTETAYVRLGSVGSALAKYADAIVDALGEDGSERARRLLLQLVKTGRGTEDTRQSARREEVIAAAGGGDDAERVLLRLSGGRAIHPSGRGGGRLVVVSRDAGGERVDLAHEALLREWGRLRGWIKQERQALELRDDVEDAARIWAGWDSPDSLLLKSYFARFQHVQRSVLTQRAQRFLEHAEHAAKRAEEEARAREEVLRTEAEERARAERMKARVFAAAAVALLVAFGVAGWQYAVAHDAAQNAEMRERLEKGLRASALAEQPGREMEALMLGIDSVAGRGADPNRAPTVTVEGMVHGFMRVRQLATLEGHTNHVLAVTFSPDGMRLATASADKTARVWDATNGRPLATLQGHTAGVHTVTFSPDGTVVATASWGESLTRDVRKDGKPIRTPHQQQNENAVILWDSNDGKQRNILHGHTKRVNAVVFSPSGTYVATASDDTTARLWNAVDGKPLVTLQGHTDSVNTLAISPDGTHVATASDDCTVRLWDATSGELLTTILDGDRKRCSVRSVAFSPDGTQVAIGYSGGKVRLCDTIAGNPVATLQDTEGFINTLNTVAFSPDGMRLLLAASSGGAVRLWDANDTKLVADLPDHWVTSRAAFSPDSTRVVTGSWDNWDGMKARLWDAKDGKPIATLYGHKAIVMSVAFSPDGMRVATGSQDGTARLWDADGIKSLTSFHDHTDAFVAAISANGTRVATKSRTEKAVRLWDANEGKFIATLQGYTRDVDTAGVGVVVFSPDGTRVVTSTDDNTTRLWDAVTGNPIVTLLENMRGGPGAVVFSPDSTRVATARRDAVAHRGMQIWDVTTGNLMIAIKSDTFVKNLVFSADGKRIAAIHHDNVVRFWDTGNGKQGGAFGHKNSKIEFRAIAFSPDGTRVATGNTDNIAQIWDAVDGKLIATLDRHYDMIKVLAFSPDGTCLATGSMDGTARLWNVKDRKPIATLEGHRYGIMAVAFSPDSTRVATGSNDSTVRIWDTRDGQLLAILPHRKQVASVAFSHSGRHVVTGSDDGTVRTWAATPRGFLIQACQYVRPWPEFVKVADTCASYLDGAP